MRSGWVIELTERDRIRAVIRPVYNDTFPQNLMCEFGATQAPSATSGGVVGWFDDQQGQQMVIFRIDGSVLRPDGRPYQLSWSRDYALMGKKPFDSRKPLLITEWQSLDEPVVIALVPQLFR